MGAHRRRGHIVWDSGPGWIRKDLERAENFKAFLVNFYVILKILAEPLGFFCVSWNGLDGTSFLLGFLKWSL